MIRALPKFEVRAAVETFDVAEAEALAVVDDPTRRRVLGLLTEADALRRYSGGIGAAPARASG